MSSPGIPDVATLVKKLPRPQSLVVTAGMPYANGPLHLGHLAGAQLPADIYARFWRMALGKEKVLFVCGTDDHGSTSELAAVKAGLPIREFIDGVHEKQRSTLHRYAIGLDAYSGTSRPECFPSQKALCHDFLGKLDRNGLLKKKSSRQWFDPKASRFLPDRFVRGRCPNPRCDNPEAYGDECDRCGHQHEPDQLIDPRSAFSDATPLLKETVHWYLDMWAVSDTLRQWIGTKEKAWRPYVLAEVRDKVAPSLRFDNTHEAAYKELKQELPPHKMKYAPGKKVLLQFEDKPALAQAKATLEAKGLAAEVANEWALRAISRDIAWGVPLPDKDAELSGKTLYVWPDSLIAPLAFTQVALEGRKEPRERWKEYWCRAGARVVQFLGQDNVFFYVLMQGAMWVGTQTDPHRLPGPDELQLTDVVANCHLLVGGEKMSKSRGNFYTADQLIDERGYDADQVRYYLALLSLAEKPADFDFAKLDERNAFLAGPMNAAFERPISACHSKFSGRVPEGKLLPKVESDTQRIVARYLKAMERADYPNLLFEIENYARSINSLFTQYKPHDDRHPEESRRDALYSSFYVLKTLMLLLHPFVPQTVERLREALRLPDDVFRLEELGTPIPAGHAIGPQGKYFPAVEKVEKAEG